jgi:Flp pilus assembly protein TadG
MSVSVRAFLGAPRMERRGVSAEKLAMTKRIRPRRNGQRGGAAVEFAIVMPIFCAVVFGIIDYGWFFYQRFTVAAAIRDGLRTGVTISQLTGDPAATAIQRAKDNMANSGVPYDPNMFSTSTTGGYPTRALVLTANYTFRPLVNFIPMPKTSQTYSMTMMFEQQVAP